MDNAHVLILFILSLTVLTVTCQTFHYSPPDWTNGKRSPDWDNVLVNCELQKLRLLLQGSINSQVSDVGNEEKASIV